MSASRAKDILWAGATAFLVLAFGVVGAVLIEAWRSSS